jgi:putative PIG3 family NAD(P)H quinone oxidoreductase
MQAVVVRDPGSESALALDNLPDPVPAPDEILIRVHAAGVNRADLLQRRGLYPPPPGASPLLGLECAGEVVAVGSPTLDPWIGRRVMALLPGGGYAELVTVHSGSVIETPAALSDDEAGGVPEAFLTAYLNLFELGRLRPVQAALVHGGSGGVGTAAIALCRAAGARVVVTAGSPDRCRRCRELGAEVAVDYHTDDFVTAAQGLTEGLGVDVVLDCIGGPYLERNLAAVRDGGRVVVIGLMGGRTAELDLAIVLRRHIHLLGSTLRSRATEFKRDLVRAFLDRFGVALEAGELRPVVDRVLPLADAERAHAALTAGDVFGKLVLTIDRPT